MCSPETAPAHGVIRRAGDLPEVVREAVRRVAGASATILIDGPSASGKSALAEAIVRCWPELGPGQGASEGAVRRVFDGAERGAEGAGRGADGSMSSVAVRRPVIVHMDDLYPGWDGLAAGSLQVIDDVLVPRSRGLSGRWRRHDWERDEPGEWCTVPAEGPLVVEGCGCLSRRAARLGDLCIWVDAEESVRRRRFSRRDRGAFDHEWTRWADQMAAFVAREHPRELANVIVWSA